MMKGNLSKRFLALFVFPVLIAALSGSCSKSNNTPAFNSRSSQYKMYNLSTGTAVQAGTFTITELADSSVKLSIQLDQGYRLTGAKFKTTITAPQLSGNDLLFADLGDMDGGTGTLEVNPVVSGATNQRVRYNDFIQSGYMIKVMNGSNLQASGVIK